jgi:hypothetical protein
VCCSAVELCVGVMELWQCSQLLAAVHVQGLERLA